MKRRNFIFCIIGAASVGWSGWKLRSAQSKLTKFTKSGRALGTQVVITVFGPDEVEAQRATERAFEAIEQVEQVMSLYREDSQLSQLNREGILAHPHPDLVRVLQRAARLSEQTQGAFDVTVQPLWHAYHEAAQVSELPSLVALDDALRRVDWRQVQISSQVISLGTEGVAVTLNGIAQGFAADAAAEALRSHGITHAIIDTGEIGILGSHPEREMWTLGIKHPRDAQALLGVAEFNGRCLATSGDYETVFSVDRRFNHLLDPRTGRSPLDLASVSILAPTAMEADALSTAVFVMGPEKGRKLVETLPKVDALFVDKASRVTRTAGFPFQA